MKRNLQTAEHRLQSGQSLMQQAESEVPNRFTDPKNCLEDDRHVTLLQYIH